MEEVTKITNEYAKKIENVGKARYRNNLEEARDNELLKLKEDYDAELAALSTDTIADKQVQIDEINERKKKSLERVPDLLKSNET